MGNELKENNTCFGFVNNITNLVYEFQNLYVYLSNINCKKNNNIKISNTKFTSLNTNNASLF